MKLFKTALVAGLALVLSMLPLLTNCRTAAQFNQSKRMALIAATYVAALYFIGWLVIVNEWFGMWQSTKINTLPDAFWLFGEGMPIAIWVNTPDL